MNRCAINDCIASFRHLLKIFVISLFAYSLYTHVVVLIFIMWDYFYVITCAGDVASHGASDHAI